MLDPQLLRNQPDVIEESLRHRGMSADAASAKVSAVVDLDQQVRSAKSAVDELRAQRNSASKAIGAAKGRGEDASEQMAQVRALGEDLSAREHELVTAEAAFNEAMLDLPNIVQSDVPTGGEDEGAVLREVGTRPDFAFAARDHLDIAEALGLIDMERGARTSGSRFAYLMGDLVRVQYALVQLALDRLSAAGFTPVVPPVLVREEAMWGTGFFPTDRSQIYQTHDDLFLVGTAEVPLAALHADEILNASELPLRYAGVSSCFRREAGAAGKDTRGIFRVHQFDKIEMFSFTTPEQSTQEHQHILAQEEAIVSSLGLPYRVVDIAAGDLGASASRKYDIEVWLPGQARYRELTSCSNCTDYQARRLRARMRKEGSAGTQPVHTLNGTAIAIGRMLVALLENHQQADGTVALPEILHAYGAPKHLGVQGAATAAPTTGAAASS